MQTKIWLVHQSSRLATIQPQPDSGELTPTVSPRCKGKSAHLHILIAGVLRNPRQARAACLSLSWHPIQIKIGVPYERSPTCQKVWRCSSLLSGFQRKIFDMKVVRFGLKTNLTTLFIVSRKTKTFRICAGRHRKDELAKNTIFSKQAAITPEISEPVV